MYLWYNNDPSQSEVVMSFTTKEQIRLLEGENEAADALAMMLKVALDKKILNVEKVQQDLHEAVESWFALREQRVQAQTMENPSHMIN